MLNAAADRTAYLPPEDLTNDYSFNNEAVTPLPDPHNPAHCRFSSAICIPERVHCFWNQSLSFDMTGGIKFPLAAIGERRA